VLSGFAVQTAISSKSELAFKAGKCARADHLPETLALSRPSLILDTIFLLLNRAAVGSSTLAHLLRNRA
jgi:hypothetical protein